MEIPESAVVSRQMAIARFIFQRHPLLHPSEGQAIASVVIESPESKKS